MRKLNLNQLNHIFNLTPRQPEIKSKFSKSLTQPSRITCSSILFNMCYTTPAQPKIFTNKIIQRCTHSIWFFKPSENDFKCLHLHNLKSLRRYHVHYTRTTWSYDISTIWFQDSTPAQPEIFVDDMILHYTRTTWLSLHSYNLITGFYTCTTWNLYPYCKIIYFTLHSHTLIFITFAKYDFLGFFILVVCLCFVVCHISYLYLCLN